MDVLNTVVNILHLIADVVIGVTQVTWMISKDVFRDKPKAKHYSKRNNAIKSNDRLTVPQLERSLLFNTCR